MEGYASEVGSREVASLVSDLLPVLIDKAGDNNSRIRSDTVPCCAVLFCAVKLDGQGWGQGEYIFCCAARSYDVLTLSKKHPPALPLNCTLHILVIPVSRVVTAHEAVNAYIEAVSNMDVHAQEPLQLPQCTCIHALLLCL